MGRQRNRSVCGQADMGKVVLVINHWAVPHALHLNVCREVQDHAPHVVPCFCRTASARDNFHGASEMFQEARVRGFHTVCLGVTEYPEPEGRLVDCASRFQASQGVDHASTWSTYPWRATSHDREVIRQAFDLLSDVDEDAGGGDLLLCLNLLSCRDVLHAAMDGDAAAGLLDHRLIPPTVADATTFSVSFQMAVWELKVLFTELDGLLALASRRGASIAMCVLSSFALGEHGMFGDSYMKEGTTSVLASSLPCTGTGYVDTALATFVQASVQGTPTIELGAPFPFQSTVHSVTRCVDRVNDRPYAFVGGSVFDLTLDPDETRDVRTDVARHPTRHTSS